MCSKRAAAADDGLVLRPGREIDAIDRISSGVEQEDDITGVGEPIADATVVGKGGDGKARGCAAAKEYEAAARRQLRRVGKGEAAGGVVVAELPARERDRIGAGVDQLYKFVGVGLAHAVAIGVAGSTCGRVGEDFINDYGSALDFGGDGKT